MSTGSAISSSCSRAGSPRRAGKPSICGSEASPRTRARGHDGRLRHQARAAGEIVGTAAVRVLEPGVGELKRMWLRPACQGQGLGRRLLDASLLEARSLGCRALRLDSQIKLAAAVHLYRVNGFQEIPRYNDNPRADIWMERAL